MKVYIISEVFMHEGETIRAVFLDEEKARERLAQMEKDFPILEDVYWYDLTEHDVEE